MKKTAIFLLLIFIYGCGYTAVYKNIKTLDLKVNIISTEGDLETNSLLKKQIKLFSNNESKNVFNIDIKSDYQKGILTKDAKGIATNYKLDGKFNFKIYFKDREYSMNIHRNIHVTAI